MIIPGYTEDFRQHMITTDLDGTILPANGEPTNRSIRVVRSLREACVMSAATGGPLPFARDAIEALELTDPCLLSGGAQIYDPRTKKIIWQQNIDPAELFQVQNALDKMLPKQLMVCNGFTRAEHASRDAGVLAHDLPKGAYFINISHLLPTTAEAVVKRLRELKLQNTVGTVATPSFAPDKHVMEVHISHKDATKLNIVRIMRAMGILPKNCIAFGDADNDLKLFEGISPDGLRIAMGNSSPKLLAAADMKIGTVAEDGMAIFLEDWARAQGIPLLGQRRVLSPGVLLRSMRRRSRPKT
jgi:hydroxymethylpyrimidine pyrophosphatase-like HAD family hydrolase